MSHLESFFAKCVARLVLLTLFLTTVPATGQQPQQITCGARFSPIVGGQSTDSYQLVPPPNVSQINVIVANNGAVGYPVNNTISLAIFQPGGAPGQLPVIIPQNQAIYFIGLSGCVPTPSGIAAPACAVDIPSAGSNIISFSIPFQMVVPIYVINGAHSQQGLSGNLIATRYAMFVECKP
jgi:hypothetical protein